MTDIYSERRLCQRIIHNELENLTVNIAQTWAKDDVVLNKPFGPFGLSNNVSSLVCS